MGLLRRHERLLVIYFVYTAILGYVLPLRQPIPLVTFVLNLTVIAGYFLLAYADSLRRRQFLSIVRDWLPPPLFLLAYREMGWFAPSHHTFELEQSWIVWDRFFLNNMGVRAAIEFFGPIVPSVLEIAYSLVFAIPYFCLLIIYIYRRRERVDLFLFPFALGVLVAYSLFPYFPSEPPRTVFPGEDFPSWNTIFRRFNWGLLGGYGIHTSVFPSAHVSGAFSAALAMRYVLPEKKWVGRALLALAIMIATATVYGRYHYLVDALAGLGIGAAACWLVRPRRVTSPKT